MRRKALRIDRHLCYHGSIVDPRLRALTEKNREACMLQDNAPLAPDLNEEPHAEVRPIPGVDQSHCGRPHL